MKDEIIEMYQAGILLEKAKRYENDCLMISEGSDKFEKYQKKIESLIKIANSYIRLAEVKVKFEEI
jgi:hypothetical protein